jgi:hypothetical protein
MSLLKRTYDATMIVAGEWLSLAHIPCVYRNKTDPQFAYQRETMLRHIHSPFIPKHIAQSAKRYNHLTELQYRYVNSSVRISILHARKKDITLQNLTTLLQSLHVFIRVAPFFMNPSHLYTLQSIDIFLIDAPDKKEASADTRVLGPEHVNSGSTMFHSGKPNHILVYRHEERIKVLLHELVHYSMWDADILPDMHVNTLIQQIQSVHSIRSTRGLAPREAVTDIIAIFLRTVFEVGVKNPAATWLVFQKRFVKEWSRQTKWMHMQAARVLQLQYGRPQLPHEPDHVFVEDTHTFAYYVIKSAMAHQANTFFSTFVESRPDSLDNICAFIMKCLADPEWNLLLPRIRLVKSKGSPITLRMNMYQTGGALMSHQSKCT